MFHHVFQQGPNLVWGVPFSMRMIVFMAVTVFMRMVVTMFVVVMFMAMIMFVRMIVIIVHKNLHPLAGIPARGIFF
jgi:hypothetical protein